MIGYSNNKIIDKNIKTLSSIANQAKLRKSNLEKIQNEKKQIFSNMIISKQKALNTQLKKAYFFQKMLKNSHSTLFFVIILYKSIK